MKETAEFNTQKQIYRLIEKEPGLHLNKIAELLKLNRPLVIYHLHYLEKQNLITIDRGEGFTRCYVRGVVGVEDKKKLAVLRKETPLRIVQYLLQHPCSKHKDILDQFHIAKSTLSYHLEQLVKHGIIAVSIIGDDQGYLVLNEQEIIRFLIQYKPSRIALGMNETWQDFSFRKPRIEK